MASTTTNAKEYSLIIESLGYIDRAMMPFERRYPNLIDEFRSRAQWQLCNAASAALATPNPLGYMLITIRNAFRMVERSYLRERRRWHHLNPDMPLVSFVPRPDLIAMAREEIDSRNVPPPTPTCHAIRAEEWELFDRIVTSNPRWNNRLIAEEFNRKTGRKLNMHSVWTHRKKRGLTVRSLDPPPARAPLPGQMEMF